MIFFRAKNVASLTLGELFIQLALDYDLYYGYEFEYSEGDAGTVCRKAKEELFQGSLQLHRSLNSKTYVGGKNAMVRRRIMFKSLYCTLITWRRVPTCLPFF
jgi:hypothetical protein